MMMQLGSVLLALVLVAQATSPQSSTAPSGCLSDLDKQRLSVAGSIEKRIKIRKEISDRFHKAVEQAEKKQQTEEVAALLVCWGDHLAASQYDIESNINRKKRSGALKDFEIQLRKSIRDMEDSRLKAPYQEMTRYNTWIELAKKVRDRFVDILFQR